MIRLTEEETSALTTNRVESWRFELLTREEAPLGKLEGITSGTFDFSNAATIRSGGTLSYEGVFPVKWDEVRIQAWYTTRSPSGLDVTWPVGVFIPASPGENYTRFGITEDIDVYDKLLILDQDKVEGVWSYDVGEVVTDVIDALIRSTGETHLSLTDSGETLRTAQFWEPGTSKLRIINDLLSSINYFSIWVDGSGYFQANPHKAPSYRGVSWSFIDDHRSIYSAEFRHNQDSFDVPNRFVIVGQSDGEEEALTSVATNRDSLSPYSYERRGRWITQVEEGVEATSQEVLDALAARRLVDVSQVASTIEFPHSYIPLELNDAVTFRRGDRIDVLGVVEKYSISTGVGELVKTTIREVVR